MKKIRFFFLQALFFGTPLIYAWFYIPGLGLFSEHIHNFFSLWGLSFDFGLSGFESVKVYFFFICIFGALVSHISALLYEDENVIISQTLLVSFGVFFIWTIGSLWLNHDINTYFTFGNYEKRHGWFFYAALFTTFFLLRSLSLREHKRLFLTSMLSFLGVIAYAIFQKIGIDPSMPFYQTRLSSDRIFASLGNPNYLAGYTLIIMPLVLETVSLLRLKYMVFVKGFIILFSGVILFWTGSYLAWVLYFAFIAILLHKAFFDKKYYSIASIGLGLCAVMALSIFLQEYGRDLLEMQKMKGFIARWYLWKTGINALTADLGHFLFGYGPDGFLAVSQHFRHPLLSVYEDPAYRIDRSHNVFIDFALHFGVPALFIILFFIGRSLPRILHGKRSALLLFALYFSFNIPVLIHFLIVLQILTYPQSKKLHHG